jgi:queuine tRNA-ribosyltransferase
MHEEPRASWRLLPGDLLETLVSERAKADLVFWDPYSPRVNPDLWTVLAFRRLRERCLEEAAVFTYSTATSVRAALLLSGFFVGVGDPSGPKQETTAAATRRDLLARPLEARWLERLDRSSAPLPADAPSDALELLRAHPQFR